MKMVEISPAQAQKVVTPWGQEVRTGAPIRVPETDRLAEYARRSPARFKIRVIDSAAEAARRAAAVPKPIRRRRQKVQEASPAPAKAVPTPTTRSELLKQLAKDNRATLKGRAEEFGLLVSTGATKAELKADIIAAFDARAQAAQGDQPDPS